MPDYEPSLLRLGTSSWSSKDWVGAVYPASTRPADFIAEYAKLFSTVEIDSTYYGIPRAATVKGWRDRTPPEFTFAAKAPGAITHEKFLKNCYDELGAFLKTMSLLESRLGPLLFQFPYYAKKSGVTAKDFVDRLHSFLPALPREDGFQFAVEVRNKAWIAPRLLDELAAHGVALALIDHPWMHPPERLARMKTILTGPFAYIRWLGDRGGIEKLTTRWDKTVLDRSADLARWTGPVRQILARGRPTFGFFNNHYSGHAPGDVRRFAELIKIA